MLSLHPDYISAGKNKGRHLLDVSPISHQGTDAVQAPRASGFVNGRLALTVLKQQKAAHKYSDPTRPPHFKVNR